MHGATTGSPDVIRAIPLGLFFDYLGVRLDAAKAEGKAMVINWNFPDTKQQVRLNLENSVLSHDAMASRRRTPMPPSR